MVSMEKIVHKLKIAGEEYRIVSDESAEYMQSLAHELDVKMSAIMKGSHISTTQAAVLVALQLLLVGKIPRPSRHNDGTRPSGTPHPGPRVSNGRGNAT